MSMRKWTFFATIGALFISSVGMTQILRPGKVQLKEVKNSSGAEFYAIELTGTIAYPMSIEFKELVEKMTNPTKPLILHLNSGGGAASEGLKIISLLRREIQNGRKVTTTVHNGEICGSMCVPVYLQGQKRFAGEIAAFMFHGVVRHGFTNIPDQAKTREYLRLFVDAGVPQSWLDKMWDRKVYSTPGNYWMTAAELMKDESNIITDLLPRHDIQTPWEAPIDPQIRPR